MLVSVVVELESLDDQRLPITHGHLAHAALLHSVEQHRPDLSHELHHGARLRPFTVSPLLDRFHAQDGRLRLQARDRTRIRFTSLNPALSELLVRFDQLIDQIGLGSAQFAVRGVRVDPSDDPWAARTTAAELWGRWFEPDAHRIPRRIPLRFETPTTFHQGDHELPLPVPEHVFRSLSRHWAAFTQAIEPAGVVEQFRSRIWVARHEIRTHKLRFDRERSHVGFQGDCEFQIARDAGDQLARIANLLVDFAFYAGVGYKTHWGMGQARRS